MEHIKILSAKYPRRYIADTDTITLDVQFAHLPEPVSFTACQDDPEEHGRELYVRALFGEYGPITELPKPLPTEAEQQARLSEALTRAAVIMAPLQDACDLGVATPEERLRLDALKRHRVTLVRLPESEGWPMNVVWPELAQ